MSGVHINENLDNKRKASSRTGNQLMPMYNRDYIHMHALGFSSNSFLWAELRESALVFTQLAGVCDPKSTAAVQSK